LPAIPEQDALTLLTIFKGIVAYEGRVPIHDIHLQTLAAIGQNVFDSPFPISSLPATSQGA